MNFVYRKPNSIIKEDSDKIKLKSITHSEFKSLSVIEVSGLITS